MNELYNNNMLTLVKLKFYAYLSFKLNEIIAFKRMKNLFRLLVINTLRVFNRLNSQNNWHNILKFAFEN